MSDYEMDNYDAAAEEERRREERRAAIRAAIAALRAKINRLREFLDALLGKQEASSGEVHEPETEYDLTVSEDIAHWTGSREQRGEGKQGSTGGDVGFFESGISQVIAQIERLIARYEEEISALESELASI
ncbi:DUF5082 domain-containing protein [Butyrivibrio sp. X503]|uniref:DUF5082 family protein n=1 Tax=Butyrivibrio sp. X503 TaxID=2364878 RepID=UPI000EAA8796|nr:DUF5082 family protein [Butyrivibrio sp. X503]RKM53849.1 DUF5082 domain-containing protein [Butyrivibrio sp. X503]